MPHFNLEIPPLLRFLDNINLGLIAVDKQRKIVYWNDWVSRASGRKFDAAQGRSIEQVFPEIQQNKIFQGVIDAVEYQKSVYFSSRLNKQQFPFFADAQDETPLDQRILIRPEDLRPNEGGCFIQIEDISAATRRERLLKERSAALDQSRSYLDSMIHNTTFGIITVDETGAVETMNPGTEKLFKGAASDIVGQNVAPWLPCFKSISGTDVSDIAVGEPWETEAFDAAGIATPVEVTLSAMVVENRQKIICILQDITRRKEAEAAVIQAQAELETKVEERTRELSEAKDIAERTDRAKTQVLANMSHEFRTPLNAIIGFSEMMESEVFGDLGHDNYRDYAASINSSGAHLLNLIEQALDVSQIESGVQTIQETKFNVDHAVRACCSMLAMQAEERNVSLSLDIPPETPTIIGDQTRFQQIFVNLIGNAIKYNKQDGDVRVTAVSLPGESLTIRVEDTGVGISSEELPEVLKKFGRASDSYVRAQEGLGLGLTIVQLQAEISEWDFQLESEAGVGTSIEITIPPEKLIF